MKRMLSLILAVSMMVTQYPISTFAAPQNTIEGETTEITTDQDDFQIEDGILIKYLGEGGEVVIPEGVTEIGSFAFENCTTLTKVTMPDSVIKIEESAFASCTNLENVVFSSNLKEIGLSSFQDCGLITIEFPDSLEIIGDSAFDNCTNITGDLIIPDSVSKLGNAAFRNCSSLDGILKISNSLTEIQDATFLNCEKLKGELIIPDSVTSIGAMAFSSCKGFTGTLELPISLAYLGYGAFQNCTNLTGDLIIPNNVTCIEMSAFENCLSLDGELVLSNKLTEIKNSTFRNCEKISGDLVIPEGVTRIESFAFSSCIGINGELILPSTLIEIESQAFSSGLNLQGSLVLPDELTCVGPDNFNDLNSISSMVFGKKFSKFEQFTFQGCDNVVEITFTNPTPAKIESAYNPFLNMDKLETIYVPPESYELYLEEYNSYLPEGVSIKNIDTSNDFQIENGTLVKYIGDSERVVIPEDIVAIGPSAFQDCTILSEVIMPDCVEMVGINAFEGCINLKKVSFSNSLVSIGDNAFRECTSLIEIELPFGLEAIGNFAFYNCESLSGDLIIPDSVMTLGSNAFCNCTSLDGHLSLSHSLSRIESGTFDNCIGLTGDLIIPDSITLIDSNSFRRCGFDGEISLPSSLSYIGRYAFGDCEKMKGALILPDGSIEIESYAFYGMRSISSITFGENFRQFGHSSFQGLYNVMSVSFKSINPPGIPSPSLYYDPFKDMDKLEKIFVPKDSFSEYVKRYKSYVNDSVLFRTIEDTGDFIIDDNTLYAYLGSQEEVIIPEDITIIYDKAFKDCKDIKKVIMNNDVLTIGAEAFRDCSNLETVEFSNKLNTIGDGSFRDCINLKEIDLPDSLEKIQEYAFYGCESVIGNLVLPESVSSIDAYAFAGCSGLSGNLIIPDNVITLGTYAFSGCSGLDGTLKLSEKLTYISRNTFEGCSSFVGDLIIPETVTGIGDEAFQFCGFTGKLSMPDSVIGIGNYAFYGCNFTGRLVLSNHLKTTGYRAFQNMDSITSIIFGEEFNTFAQSAFESCDNVTEVVFKGNTVPFINSSYSFYYNPFRTMEKLEAIYVPEDSFDSYVKAYTKYVKEGVEFLIDSDDSRVSGFHVTKQYSKSVELSWNQHINDEVIEYVIYRDNIEIGRTSGNLFVDRGLNERESYVYEIKGVLLDGTLTDSEAVTVELCDPKILDLQSDHHNKIDDNNSTIQITVDNKFNNSGPLDDDENSMYLYYLVNHERRLIGKANFAGASFQGTAGYSLNWDITGYEDGDYVVVAVYTDVDGTSVEYRKTITIDRSRPEKIVSVSAISGVNGIFLSWAISGEVDTETYRIYRRAAGEEKYRLLKEISGRDILAYTDTSVEANQTYYYYVVGVNEFGREGEPSDVVGATLADDTEAPVVTKITPANSSYLSGQVNFTVSAQDNVSVTKTALFYSIDDGKSWNLIGEANASESIQFDSTQFADGKVRIKGVAYDAVGNESSALTYVYSIDNTGPSKVENLAYESTSVTVTLSWDNVLDEDIRYYRVEKRNEDGSYTKVSDVYNTLGCNLYRLIPSSEYIYRVVGYDHLGNRGIPSDDIAVMTKEDTTAPVITKIRPTSGYYSKQIDIRITAEDEYNVASLTLQVSRDGTQWEDIYTETYENTSKTRTMEYSLGLGEYEEGELYIRGIAVDTAENISDVSNEAPYVQHMVDKTPPEAPSGVKAEGHSGYIEISWEQGTETDLNTYNVYRSETEGGNYPPLATGLKTLNYIDRTAEEGKTYYYSVAVTDQAGNLSMDSASVSAQVIADTEAPEIVSVYPENGTRLGNGYKTISVLAVDNQELNSILIETSDDGEVYEKLYAVTGVDEHSRTIHTTIPVDQYMHGDTLYVRVSAEDHAGNQSGEVIREFVVDTQAPVPATASASYSDEDVTIQWRSNQESDLIGYRVYRKTGETGSYQLISQRQVVEGQQEYACHDYNLSLGKTTYYYRIDAVDDCGNVASLVTNAVSIPDRSAPKPVISCDNTMEAGVEYRISAANSSDNSKVVSYHFDFGDGTESTQVNPVHVYKETGTYTITLTVTDDDGNEASIEKEITVKERSAIGTARIRIVDENGVAVPGAPVYFDLAEEDQVIKVTDSSGYVSFTADAGKHTVGCVIADNEWLPVKKEIIIQSGQQTDISMTLIHHVMIEGQFEIERMTFEEIIAAGIDVSKPENQYIVNINVALTYGKDTVETSFQYNQTTGQTISKPTIVTTSDGGKRQIVPVVLNPGGLGGNTGKDYVFSSEPSIAYLDIPVGASALKEFFDVNLHIINNASSEFSMLDNVIELNVPEGLSIVETSATESNAQVNIAEIKGQTTRTISWILRGDQVGSYQLSADYSGILSEFNEPVYTQFLATEPIEVFGLSNLKMKMEIPDELDHGTFYYNVSLQNQGRIDVYRPRIETGDTIIETQLFDETGANVVESHILDAEDIDGLDIAESLEGDTDILPAGYLLSRHYMCVDQTLYTEKKQELVDFAYEMENTYGIEFEIVTRPLSYFKSNLSATINASEKADLTFTDNQDAYQFLMDNENYIYWNMFESTIDGLPSNNQETLWNLLEFIGGGGGFKSLFGEDDDELIQVVILDMMEISAEKDDHMLLKVILDWSKGLTQWLEGQGAGDWSEIVSKYVKSNVDKFAKDKIPYFIETISKSLPDGVNHRFMGDLSSIGAYLAQKKYRKDINFDDFMVKAWRSNLGAKDKAILDILPEEDQKSMLREMYVKDSFKTVWTTIGFGFKEAQAIVEAAEQTSMDVSVYLLAQAKRESYVLFLDTLIDGLKGSSGDAKKVADTAEYLKQKMLELDVWGSFFEHAVEESFWTAADFTFNTAMDKVGLSAVPMVKAIKEACNLTTSIGNSIFNVGERLDIADNIRFVSHISKAMQTGIVQARETYRNDKSEVNAQIYMQLLSYMLNVRAVGESQVASFGISYEVVPGSIDSEELFLAVKDMSGAVNANSWVLWRDFVEDRISNLRVQLLKNPVTSDMSGTSAPIVTFDYLKGQTMQSFSSEYEYSIDGGATWTTCSGGPISVALQYYTIELQVRKSDIEDSMEKQTTSIMIYGVPSLKSSSIQAIETESGYRIEGLDPDQDYEFVFANDARVYPYGQALENKIPAGSMTYEIETEEEFSYLYVRSLASSGHYASYAYAAPVHPMVTLNITVEGSGTASGAGTYEYGKEISLSAWPSASHKFSGWYEDHELISKDASMTFKITSDRNLVARFITDDTNWHLDKINYQLEGVVEKTTAKAIIDHYQDLGHEVEVIDVSGDPLEQIEHVGTGCQLILDGTPYTIVVLGDVNGDAVIDLFDTYDMLNHINNLDKLVGPYLQAALIRAIENADIDLFDYFAEVDYINKGSFDEQEAEE